MIQLAESMKIGIPHIDRQHQQLVDTINELSALNVANPDREEVKKCLDFLGEYVVRHFSDEEKLQVESKYPRYRAHKAIHEEFVGTYKSLYAEFEKRGPSPVFVSEMTKRMSSWVITHIRMEDVKFGAHYSMVKLEQLKTHSQ